MMSTAEKPEGGRKRGRTGLAAALAGAALAAGLAYGIETNMVELGRESVAGDARTRTESSSASARTITRST